MSKKTERRPTHHLLLVVDASGSMYSLADDVRGGFNQYLKDLDPAQKWRVSVCLFNTSSRMLAVNKLPSRVPLLDETNYQPVGGTALNDAIGGLIESFEAVDDRDDDRVLMVVNTDGYENSSREWKNEGIKALIESKRRSGRWEFVFLGADPEAWEQGIQYGMASTMTVNSRAGTRSAYQGMSVGTRKWSEGASAQSVTEAVDTETAKVDPDDAA